MLNASFILKYFNLFLTVKTTIYNQRADFTLVPNFKNLMLELFLTMVKIKLVGWPFLSKLKLRLKENKSSIRIRNFQ
jgi:hypothetical protein